MSLKGTIDSNDLLLTTTGPTISGSEKETSAWYAGGRIGYLVTPNLLTYFDGGYTQTHFGSTTVLGTAFPAGGPTPWFSPSQNYHGWFLGGGEEYALNFAWLPIHGLFWRTEYRFAEYSARDVPLLFIASGAPTLFAENIKPYTQTITSSLIWRFNWIGH